MGLKLPRSGRTGYFHMLCLRPKTRICVICSPEISLREGQDRASVWFRGHFHDDLLPILRQQLAALRLKSAEWPRILFAHLTAPPGSDERQSCLTWLRYEPLDDNVSDLWQVSRAENPYRDRFSEPHLLKPLSRAEAEELIDLSLKSCSPPEQAVRKHKDSKWLDSVFVGRGEVRQGSS